MQISVGSYCQNLLVNNKAGKNIEASQDTREIFKYLIDQVESFDFKNPKRIQLFDAKYQFELKKNTDFTFDNKTDLIRPYWTPRTIVFQAVGKKTPIQAIEFTMPYDKREEGNPANKYSMIIMRFLDNGSISYFPASSQSKRNIAQDLARKIQG